MRETSFLLHFPKHTKKLFGMRFFPFNCYVNECCFLVPTCKSIRFQNYNCFGFQILLYARVFECGALFIFSIAFPTKYMRRYLNVTMLFKCHILTITKHDTGWKKHKLGWEKGKQERLDLERSSINVIICSTKSRGTPQSHEYNFEW